MINWLFKPLLSCRGLFLSISILTTKIYKMAIVSVILSNTALKFTEHDGDYFYVESNSIHSNNPSNGKVKIYYDSSFVELIQSEVVTPISTNEQDLADKIGALIETAKKKRHKYRQQYNA